MCVCVCVCVCECVPRSHLVENDSSYALEITTSKIIFLRGDVYPGCIKASLNVIVASYWDVAQRHLRPLKVSVTVRGVGMFMRLFEKSYKV